MKDILEHMQEKKLLLHNTLSGQKEEFKPIEINKVGIYNCGPTVYDTVHIGNLRSFVLADLLRRVFEYNKYEVTQVMNITDIDDKTIRRSKEKGIPLKELTLHYEKAFLDDLSALNIQRPTRLLRATENIDAMIKMISTLIEKKFAYIARDGVYFSIEHSKDYGKLARIDLNTLSKERITNDEYDKENPRDFALWKFDEEYWDAPFGKGRPGWHIECSAMSTSVLGDTFDIHTGGTDLIFPHHTNEIAQSEAATGKTFVNYWVHGAFMNVDDDKMSKSKNNFFKLEDLEKNDISPLAFRYWLLTSHYRSQVNFSVESLKAAQTAYIRFIESFLRFYDIGHEHVHSHGEPRDYQKEFEEKINNDLDLPGALALAWDLIKDHGIEAKEKAKILLDFDEVFGLGLKIVKQMRNELNPGIPPEISLLAETRLEARINKEWEKADAIRQEIEERGFEIKDEDEGYKLRKK